MELFAKLFSSLLIFVYHCFDRIVIHGYLSGLSRPEQVVYFFRNVIGVPVVDKAVLSKRTGEYRGWVEAFARNHKIPVEWAQKGVRKDESYAVFAKAQAPTRAEGTGERTDRCRRGNETAEPQLGLSPNRSADRIGFRRRNRPRRRSPHPEHSLPAGMGFARSLLAYLSRPHQGQLVELRSISLRIGNLEDPLGSGSDGPIYPTGHRLWRPDGHS
jgi:hypothetical protein